MDDIFEVNNITLRSLLKNDKDLMDFLYLIKNLNSLSGVEKQSRMDSRCLYEAISKGVAACFLEQQIEKIFAPITKPIGTRLPLMMTFNKTVQLLGGIRKDQSFFLRKTSVGEIYGSLWPWQSKPQNTTILLGYNGVGITDENYEELEKIVDWSLSHHEKEDRLIYS